MDDYATGFNFYELRREFGIGEDHDGDVLLSFQELTMLDQANLLFDATKGGIVLGPSHLEGGVQILQHFSVNKYKYVGEIEGNEFLSAPLSNEFYKEELIKINISSFKNKSEVDVNQLIIPDGFRCIDTRSTKKPCILISQQDYYIVNQISTRQNVLRIMELEKKLNIP